MEMVAIINQVPLILPLLGIKKIIILTIMIPSLTKQQNNFCVAITGLKCCLLLRGPPSMFTADVWLIFDPVDESVCVCVC